MIELKTQRHLISLPYLVVELISLFKQLFEVTDFMVAVIIDHGDCFCTIDTANELSKLPFKPDSIGHFVGKLKFIP